MGNKLLGYLQRRILHDRDSLELKGPKALKTEKAFLISVADGLHILPVALAEYLRIIFDFLLVIFHT